jgi:hypothetical protein
VHGLETERAPTVEAVDDLGLNVLQATELIEVPSGRLVLVTLGLPATQASAILEEEEVASSYGTIRLGRHETA